MSKIKKYILISLIPLCILLLMCIPPLITQKYGKTIQLESKITPGKNTFRGNILYLNYKISSIKKDKLDPSLLDEAKKFKGDKLDAYATLVPINSYYDVSHITLKKPMSNEIYLKCQISTYPFKDNYMYSDKKNNDMIDIIYITYPIDEYFTSNKIILESAYYKNIDKDPSSIENYNYIVQLKIYRGYAQLVDILKK